MADIDAEVIERLRAKEQLLFGLSDTLDAKAGLALVFITFLATQSGEFINNGQLPVYLKWFQWISIVSLVGAGVAAFSSLWPREHDTETAEELASWVADLRNHYKGAADPELAVRRAFRSGMIDLIQQRIVSSAGIDTAKSSLIWKSYALAGVALTLNLMTLIAIALQN